MSLTTRFIKILLLGALLLVVGGDLSERYRPYLPIGGVMRFLIRILRYILCAEEHPWIPRVVFTLAFLTFSSASIASNFSDDFTNTGDSLSLHGYTINTGGSTAVEIAGFGALPGAAQLSNGSNFISTIYGSQSWSGIPMGLSITCNPVGGGRSNIYMLCSTTSFSEGGSGSGYILGYSGGTVYIARLLSGAEVGLASASATPANPSNFVLYLYTDGAGHLRGAIDSTFYLSVTDTNVTSGYVGMGTFMSTNNQYGRLRVVDYSGGTPTPLPTPTYTPTPWNTPTPAATVQVCGSPWPVVFTPVLTPLIIPQTTPEAGDVSEPNVIYVSSDTSHPYHMIYTGSAFGPTAEALILATASSPTGPFTRYGVVIGGGVSAGWHYAQQIKIGSNYDIYAGNSRSSAIDHFTSTDGYTYTLAAAGVIKPPAFNTYCTGLGTCPTCGPPVYDMAVWLDAASGNYYGAATLQGGCPDGLTYDVWLTVSTDGGVSFQPAANVPLSSMQVGSYLYCNGRSFLRSTNGTYFSVEHINVPSTLNIEASKDPYNWHPYGTPIATPSATLFGLTDCNQTADASMFTDGSNVYVYYDGTDNTNGTGRIGYMIYPGTVDDMAACLNPTPPPTVMPTATNTPTPVTTPTATPTPCVFRFTGTLLLEGVLEGCCGR